MTSIGEVAGAIAAYGEQRWLAEIAAKLRPLLGGAVGSAGANITATEFGGGGGHKTVLTFTNYVLATVDHTTNGAQGSAVIYTFPEGVIQLLGASYNLTIARVGTNIGATAAVVGSIGSAAAAITDATLTSTEADMIASTSGTLTAGAGSLKSSGSLVATAFDGHTTPITANLNVAIPDAGSAGDDSLTISGTVTLCWADLGDF